MTAALQAIRCAANLVTIGHVPNTEAGLALPSDFVTRRLHDELSDIPNVARKEVYMTYPKKHRGRRAITIDGHHYRWKLWPSSPNSRLVVTGVRNGGQRLEIMLQGWQDPWLAISGIQVEDASLTLFTSAANTPEVIASGFVRKMIEFGLSHGWNPESSAPPLYMEYGAGKPALSGAPSQSRPELIAAADPVDSKADSIAGNESHVLTKAIRIYPPRN